MVEYCFSFGWHVCKCGFCPVQWVYLCWRMAHYRRFIRTFSPLYRFSRHPTHIPRVSRFKPPLSSRSKHLTVQRPWPHHHSRMTVTAPSQSYDRDTKTAKWPWPPSDLDTRSHVTRTLYWSAACLRSLHILGFACLPGSSCYLLGYCSCWGKDIYIYIGRIPLFFWGGQRHFNLHFCQHDPYSLDASYTLRFVLETVTCLYVLGNYFTHNILDTLSCKRWCASFHSWCINLQSAER